MQKFQTIQLENQISIERHLENYDYSSSEEEYDGDSEDAQKVIDNIFSSYEGSGIDREKILSHLINSFQSGQVVCLICISTIKKVDPVSSTENYCRLNSNRNALDMELWDMLLFSTPTLYSTMDS